jgi:hypothetical protein
VSDVRRCKYCRYDLLTSEAEACMDCLDAVDKLEQLAAKDARIAELEAALRGLVIAVGVMTPTILRAFLSTLPEDAGIDRTATEATLARLEPACAAACRALGEGET